MAEKKVLARPVYLGGELLAAGTELTPEQAEQITNPKAFTDEPTLADKVKAAQEEYERLLQAAEKEADRAAQRTADATTVKADRAENGAALARAAKNDPAAKTGAAK